MTGVGDRCPIAGEHSLALLKSLIQAQPRWLVFVVLMGAELTEPLSL